MNLLKYSMERHHEAGTQRETEMKRDQNRTQCHKPRTPFQSSGSCSAVPPPSVGWKIEVGFSWKLAEGWELNWVGKEPGWFREKVKAKD